MGEVLTEQPGAEAGPGAVEQPFRSLIASGEELVAAGRFTQAAETFAAALARSPRDGDALLGRARALLALENLAEARHVLNRALFLYPQDTRLARANAHLLTAEGRYDDAVAECDRVLAVTPGDRDGMVQKIAALQAAARLDDADRAAAEALRLCPDEPAVLLAVGRLRFDQRRYDEALEALLQAGSDAYREWVEPWHEPDEAGPMLAAIISRFPRNPAFLILRAQVFLSAERYSAAVSAFDDALKIDPANREALAGKARALRSAGEVKTAEAVLADALQKLPDNPELLVERGYLLFAQQRYDEGVEAFLSAGGEDQLCDALEEMPATPDTDSERAADAALSRLPRSTRVLNRRAGLYARKNRPSAALDAYDRALTLDPENKLAIAGKVSALHAANRLDEAEAALAAGLDRFPDDPGLLQQAGVVYLARSQYAAAARCWLALDGGGYALRAEITRLRRERQSQNARELLEAALQQRPADAVLLTALGETFYYQRSYDKALEIFERAATAAPGTDYAVRNLCFMLRLLRRFPDAELAIEAALRRLPNNSLLLCERGWLHYAQGRYHDAVASFDGAIAAAHWRNETSAALVGKIEACRALRPQQGDEPLASVITEALEKHPHNGDLLYQRARLYQDKAELERAQSEFGKAIEENPSLIDAYFQRAEVLARLGRADEAQQLVLKLQQERSDDLQIRGQIGWYYRNRKDLDRAQQKFEAVLGADPADTTAINGIGAVHFDREEYAAAEAQFRRALALEPNDANLHNNLAIALVKQSRAQRPGRRIEGRGLPALEAHLPVRRDRRSDPALLEEAERHAREALALSPQFQPAFATLAEIALKRGRPIEAERRFKAARALAPREYGDDLGALYARMGRYDEAEKILGESIDHDPASARARLELADLYLQTGRTEKAVAMCRQALAIEPDGSEPPRALAIALMRTGEYAEAAKVLRDALRTVDERKRWQLHLTYCQLLTELGDKSEDQDLYEEARREAAIAIRLKPEDPMPYFYAGLVRYRLENYPGALAAFRACLERDPDHLEAEQNARRIRALIRRDRAQTQGGLVAGVVLGGVCLALLLAIWALYFRSDKVTSTMVATMSPILLGLVFVGFLLPWLSRLKLPGLEAELSKPKEKLAPAPRISLSFGKPEINSGPG